jgi:16S rRNA (guanine(966)-N(2))-methyltransferase RsmD
LRIISGSAKGRKLADFSGKSIRPTSDRVREAVFSSLFSQLGHFTNISVLDLFAGTGAMALEALSRGAESAILVEQSRDAQKVIDKNLKTTKLGARANVLAGHVSQILPQLGARNDHFKLIFIDPPYADENIVETLQAVNDFGLLQTDGIMCVETADQVTLPTDIGSLTCIDRRKYGSTAISYYKNKDNGA